MNDWFTMEQIDKDTFIISEYRHWEEDRGYLFTGDLVYKDTLFAYYPSTDPESYLCSLERLASLPATKNIPCPSLPGHPA